MTNLPSITDALSKDKRRMLQLARSASRPNRKARIVRAVLEKGIRAPRDESAGKMLAAPKEPARFATDVRRPALALLASFAGYTNVEDMGTWARELLERSSSAWFREDFERWIADSSGTWIGRRVPALAAVIEAASELRTDALGQLIANVLQVAPSDDFSAVASVAAQRVRRAFSQEPNRAELAANLLKWIAFWTERNDVDSTTTAIPSLPYLDVGTAAKLLPGWIESGTRTTCWAAAQAVLEWSTLPTRPSQAAAERLFAAIKNRYERDHQKLDFADPYNHRAALIWAAGSIATQRDLNAAIDMFVKAFQNPVHIEDAAAVRAIRALTMAHGTNAWAAVAERANRKALPRLLNLVMRV